MATIMPARLHRVKTFECRERFIVDYASQQRQPAGVTMAATLEQQIDAWVDATKNLIVATGPVHVVSTPTVAERASADAQGIKLPGIEVEIRTLAVTYVPAVEQQSNVKIYGEPGTGPIRSVVDERQPAGQPSGERDGNAGSGVRGPLRLPPV